MLYFHKKLTSFCENELNTHNITELLDIIIKAGLLARKADRSFCDEMKVGTLPERPTCRSDDKNIESGSHQIGSINNSAGNKQVPEYYSQPTIEKGPATGHEGDNRELDSGKNGSDTFFQESAQLVGDSADTTRCEIEDEKVYLMNGYEVTDQEDRHLYLTATVYHGDCSLMRLTSRFYFGDEEKHYTFVKFAHYDDYREAEDFKALIKGKKLPSNRLLQLAGPSGSGKSFYLQYILRHIRTVGHLRAIYLAHPEIFLETKVQYLALLLELIYSLAEDIADDQSLKQFYIVQAKEMAKPEAPKFTIFQNTLNETVKMLKERGKNLVLVMDQENSYERLSEGEKGCHKFDLANYLRGESHGAYILSSLSYTSQAIKSEIPSRNFIRLLSDDAILAILKSRCGTLDRYCLSHESKHKGERIQQILELVVNTVGRCPVDLHRLMNIRNAKSSSPMIATRCSSFRPDADDITTRHEAFYNGLSGRKRDVFRTMLLIAGRCPPIGSQGYYSSQTLHVHIPASSKSTGLSASELTDERNVRKTLHNILHHDLNLTIPEVLASETDCESQDDGEDYIQGRSESAESSDDAHFELSMSSGPRNQSSVNMDVTRQMQEDEYFTVDLFSKIPGLETFASISEAERALDKRYFFIDKFGYVRPYSDPAFRVIRAFHKEKETDQLKTLLEKVRQSAPGIVYEVSFFLNFRASSNSNSSTLFHLKNAYCGNQIVFTKLSIPIDYAIASIDDMKQIFESEKKVLWQCPPRYPIADFVVICPASCPDGSSHSSFNILPYIPWVKNDLKTQLPGRYQATLILGQLTINGKTHPKGDRELCKRIVRSKLEAAKKALDRKAGIRMLVKAFLQECKSRNFNPCVLFLWITENIGNVSQYHHKSILCSSYNIDVVDRLTSPYITYDFRKIKTPNNTEIEEDQPLRKRLQRDTNDDLNHANN